MKQPINSQFLIPILFLAFMNVIWAGSYTAMKFGASLLSPLEIAFLRLSVSFFIMLIWFFACSSWQKVDKRDLKRIILAGFFVAVGQWLTITGVHLSKASNASLLFAFEPIMGILLATIILKEKTRPSYYVAMFLALVGLFVLSNPSKLDPPELGIGNLLVVAGILCEVLFSIILKPTSRRVPAMQVTLIWLAVATVTIFFPFSTRISEIKFSGAGDFFVIGYLSILCTVSGYWLWVKFMEKIPVSIMYFTIFLQPISGPVIAWIFLKETPSQRLLFAAVFLLAGLATAVSGFLRAVRVQHQQSEIDLSFDGSNIV